MRYLLPAIRDLAEVRKGQPIVPFDDFRTGRARLNLIGLEGMSMIAVSGLDMAAWDALARAVELPLAVLLGGSLAPVAAYNSNGLWLTLVSELGEQAAALIAEGKFQSLKLRLGRERPADDIAAIRAVRGTVGENVKLMVDFNQGLSFGDALHRCHALDDQGLYCSKNRSSTITSRVTHSSRESSRPPSSWGRTSTDRGRFSGPSGKRPAITSCSI
jgi:mandelate racemase